MSLRAIRNPEERFWERVNKTDGCWLWTGPLFKTGYGQFTVRNLHLRAHRYSAMVHFGMFDSRLLVLHTCDVRACVRPSHLYLGDHSANRSDMWTRSDRRERLLEAKTHCVNGHAYTEENALLIPGRGRNCRACRRDAAAKYDAKRRAS